MCVYVILAPKIRNSGNFQGTFFRFRRLAPQLGLKFGGGVLISVVFSSIDPGWGSHFGGFIGGQSQLALLLEEALSPTGLNNDATIN